jgi:hypothetical protein
MQQPMQLAQTTTEQRSEIYEDVRTLLRPGFLAHRVEINGSLFVLRSLNEQDWIFLQYRTRPDSVLDWKRWSVAASTWMVNGQSVLGDEGVLYRIYEMCRSLPSSILDDLYAVLNALMRRVREATDRIEAFLYEDESRYLWRSEGERLVADGRCGIGEMGLNPVQKLWVYFNRTEDESREDQSKWEIAKFIAGPHVPKGIKKINAKDKQTQDDLKRRRKEARDRVFYEAMGVIPKREVKAKKKERFGDWNVQLAETEEELQDEMRRWVEGVKDPHDDVIDFVKSKIKTEKEGGRARAKAQREALSRAMQEEGITKSQLVPLTGSAAAEFIERVKARVPGVSKVLQDETHNSAYDKYIKNNPEVGILSVDEEGNIRSPTQVNPEEMVEMLRKPEEGEQKDLQEQISKRRPTMESLHGDKGKDGPR